MRAVRILVVAVLASCYRPSVDPCRVTCANDSECPSGTSCTAAGVCHREGEPACGVIDPDGGPDAPIDGSDGGSQAGAFKALAVGREFACAITADGMDLVCWGANYSGQLGDTTLVPHARAMPINEPGPWLAVGAGTYHACAVKESGALFCWGDASSGQVDGTQNNQNRPDPVQMMHPNDRKWVAVDGGASHTCAIDEDTVMWCWGSNVNGQLGTDAGSGVRDIDQIPSQNGWISVTADELHTCAIKTGGGGWCWGYGALGQTGTAPTANQQSSTVPAPISGGLAWRSLSAGLGHTCGVTLGNQLFCFGEEQLGELGVASGNSATPVSAQPGSDYGFAFAGRLTTCATRTNPDRLLCFGDNRDGQLGNGDREIPANAVSVAGLGHLVAGGSGDGFTCVLDDLGVVSCFGRDDEGRCGDGTPDDHFVGPPVVGLSGPLKRLSAGADHTCAVTMDGHAYCWGFNNSGQLGVGDLVDRAVPTEIDQPGGSAWTDISAGSRHTCGIAADGLYCWGSDANGQLGNSGGSSSTPVRIQPATVWQSVTAGWELTCAIDNNSDRWCWGNNASDALGAGAGAMNVEPLPVLTNNGPAAWLRVETATAFGCGIATPQKELWCWGNNGNHQLGQGATPATSNTPLQVAGPSADWEWVAVDQLHGAVCGIRGPNSNGGNLFCWGYNASGQLGAGNTTTPQEPLEVGTARDWVRVDLGFEFACGISSALELRCWGYNDSKQVSDAAVSSVGAIPSNAIMPSVQFTDLSVGWQHGCAVTTGNQILCWGDGGSGQLGDGNKAHLTPYPVMAPP